jgi:hypothetical protein
MTPGERVHRHLRETDRTDVSIGVAELLPPTSLPLVVAPDSDVGQVAKPRAEAPTALLARSSRRTGLIRTPGRPSRPAVRTTQSP